MTQDTVTGPQTVDTIQRMMRELVRMSTDYHMHAVSVQKQLLMA